MGEVAALTAAALWALASLIYADLGRSISATVLNFAKSAVALLLLAATALILEGSILPTLGWTALGWIALSGLVGLAIGDTAFFWALNRIGARRSLLIWALAPAMTAGLGAVFLGEAVNTAMVAGIGLTTAGVAWVITEQEGGESASLLRVDRFGIFLALVAAGSQAGANILLKLGEAGVSALQISVLRLAVGVVGMGIVVGALGRLREVPRVFSGRRTAGRLILACFLGTYLGIWLTTVGLKATHAGIAATLASTSPIFILPLAWMVLGERLSPRAVTGALVAVLGIGILFGASPGLIEPEPAPIVTQDAGPPPLPEPIAPEASGM